jgi:tetratricopeptide (TPR) repeat protein
MRARLGLAEALAALGRTTEAIAHYRGLLDLNPGDNQGVRYRLLINLLEAKRDGEARELLTRYPDEISAVWRYGRALLKFRRDGDPIFATRSLGAAIVANPLVPGYLLGETPCPKQMPDYTGIGDKSEATWCAAGMAKAWSATPGASTWLAKVYHGGLLGLPRPETGSGPAFFPNPYDDWGLTRCPSCEQPTKIRKRHLGALVEPDELLPIHLTYRMCDDCDILFIHDRDARPAIMTEAASRGLDLIDQDYLLLGVIDRAAFRGRRPADTGERAWLLAHLQRFREERMFHSPWDWYPAFLVDEEESIDTPAALAGPGNPLILRRPR